MTENPVVTATINLDGNGSPTPSLPQYMCGTWVTNTSPPANTTVDVFAKYIQNIDNNPQGVGGATGTASIYWPDSTSHKDTVTVTTTSDGLAIFPIPLAQKAYVVGKLVVITVAFSKGGQSCTIPLSQPAFFTPSNASSTKNGHGATWGNMSNTPTAVPTGSPTLRTPTVPPVPSMTPQVTPTIGHGH